MPVHDHRRAHVRLSLLVLALALGSAPLEAAPRLHGHVFGPRGRPLENVRVRVYVSGSAATSAWADSTGGYAVDLPDAPEGATVLAWFVPVDDDLVPECVVLAESPALAARPFLPCLPHLALAPDGAEWSPTLLGPDEHLARLKALPCFEEFLRSSI